MALHHQMEVGIRKSHERSAGTMISTICFLGLALVFFLHASELYDAGYHAKAAGLGVCALACLAGGLRFVIQKAILSAQRHWQ